MVVYEELDAVAIGQVPCPEYALGIGAIPDDDTPPSMSFQGTVNGQPSPGSSPYALGTPPTIIQAMEPELVVETWEAIGCFTELVPKGNVATIPPGWDGFMFGIRNIRREQGTI
jgi:hypothetical protein